MTDNPLLSRRSTSRGRIASGGGALLLEEALSMVDNPLLSRRSTSRGRIVGAAAAGAAAPRSPSLPQTTHQLLPPGWVERISRSSAKRFFYSTVTGETRWTPPPLRRAASLKPLSGGAVRDHGLIAPRRG